MSQSQRPRFRRLAPMAAIACVATLAAIFATVAPSAPTRTLACDPVAHYPQGYDSSNIG